MNFLHTKQPSRAPTPPPGLVKKLVQFESAAGTSGTEAARTEWFIDGTQQASFAMDSGATGAINTGTTGQSGSKSGKASAIRIAAPTTGTIIALDPDIPPNRQRLSLESTQPQSRTLRWQVDGKTTATGGSAQWPLWPGRHVIRLLNAKDTVLDEVRLEVRGAGVISAKR